MPTAPLWSSFSVDSEAPSVAGGRWRQTLCRAPARSRSDDLVRSAGTRAGESSRLVGSPVRVAKTCSRLDELRRAERDAGIERIVVLGMGGSSLAPEVFGAVFGRPVPHGSRHDTSGRHPRRGGRSRPRAHAVRRLEQVGIDDRDRLPVRVLLAASGDEARCRASLRRHHRSGQCAREAGNAPAGAKVFRAPQDVGGRYSALSAFGLVPAALAGVDVSALVARAARRPRTLPTTLGPQRCSSWEPAWPAARPWDATN